jgi:hypothetical protein
MSESRLSLIITVMVGAIIEQAYNIDPENWSMNDLKKWLRDVLIYSRYPLTIQRDIHCESTELRDDLVKRVQEAMDANGRRQEHEPEERNGNTATRQTQEIELDDLANSKGKLKSK